MNKTSIKIDEDEQKKEKTVKVDGKTLQLKKFDVKMINEIAPNPAVIMIAKRGSGKSVALRAIMHANKDIPGGIIISRTEKMSPFFSLFFPDYFIHYKYSTAVLQGALDRQERIKEKNQRRIANGKKKLDTRIWVIMDDCLGQKKSWINDEPVGEVMYDGRHYDLFYVLTMQYPLGIGPDYRTNFDFIFIFGENYRSIRQKIYEQYAGMFPSFESFEFVFKKCTVNFGCMVINNRVKSDQIQDIVYWWKAPNKEIKRMLGSKSFIKKHYEHYEPDKKKHSLKKHEIEGLHKKKKNSMEFRVDLIN